jgi:hypothetical protein
MASLAARKLPTTKTSELPKTAAITPIVNEATPKIKPFNTERSFSLAVVRL